jgi:hypothetical protein
VLDNRRGRKAVVGTYRWLNKRYEAQVYNYGLRLVLELVVPDPAARYRYASASGAGLRVDLDPPPPLVMPDTGLPISPKLITRRTWEGLASRFEVTDLMPPPEEWITVGTSVSSDATAGQPQSTQGDRKVVPTFFRDDQQLNVPRGYQPVRWVAVVTTTTSPAVPTGEILRQHLKDAVEVGKKITLPPWWLETEITDEDKRSWDAWADALDISTLVHAADLPGGVLTVGPTFDVFKNGVGRYSAYFSWGASGPYGLPEVTGGGDDGANVLPVTVYVYNSVGYAVTITVLCRATNAFTDWQADVFAALVRRHTDWESAYRRQRPPRQLTRE